MHDFMKYPVATQLADWMNASLCRDTSIPCVYCSHDRLEKYILRQYYHNQDIYLIFKISVITYKYIYYLKKIEKETELPKKYNMKYWKSSFDWVVIMKYVHLSWVLLPSLNDQIKTGSALRLSTRLMLIWLCFILISSPWIRHCLGSEESAPDVTRSFPSL